MHGEHVRGVCMASKCGECTLGSIGRRSGSRGGGDSFYSAGAVGCMKYMGCMNTAWVRGACMGCMECRGEVHLEGRCREPFLQHRCGSMHGVHGMHGVQGEAHPQLWCGEHAWGTWGCINRGAGRGPSAAQVRGAPSARQVWGACMRCME